MTNDKWQEIFHRLTTSHRRLTVDEIKEATAEMNDGEIAKLKSAVKMQRTHLCLDNPDSPERRETFDYYNLIMRVVTNERIQPYKAPDMIMSGEVYLVPVSWVDDRTMDKRDMMSNPTHFSLTSTIRQQQSDQVHNELNEQLLRGIRKL